MRDWAAEDGRAIGVAAAEAFRAIVIDDDEDSPAPADEDTPAPTE
jgi:hypothetical protein